MRRTTFRQDGRPHTLLVIADLSKTLREEELLAWQRLVRVLSHEINNSLAPIKSIAGSLLSFSIDTPRPPDADDDLRGGLGDHRVEVRGARRASCRRTRGSRGCPPRARGRSTSASGRVAPPGSRRACRSQVSPGPPLVIQADGDQLDQLLINLVRNAADASLETGGGVSRVVGAPGRSRRPRGRR